MTERAPSLIGIRTHARMLSGFEGIWCSNGSLRGDVVSKLTDKLYRRGKMSGNNQNKMREILQWF